MYTPAYLIASKVLLEEYVAPMQLLIILASLKYHYQISKPYQQKESSLQLWNQQKVVTMLIEQYTQPTDIRTANSPSPSHNPSLGF